MVYLGLAASQRHLAWCSCVVGLVLLRLAAPSFFGAITSLFSRVFGTKLLELEQRDRSLTPSLLEQKQEVIMYTYMVLPTLFRLADS